MRASIKLLLILLFAFTLQNKTNAQDSLFVFPTYTLTVTNISQPQPNIYDFDIYMRHTNGNATVFIYGTGQYYLSFNPGIAFPGDTLKYSIIDSDLPQEYRPVNPSITGNILRTAPNLPTNPDDSPRIDTSYSGTLIAKMRLRTTGASFTNFPLNIAWRSELPNPFTKIAAYSGENNYLLYEIQNPISNIVGNYFYTQLVSPANNSINNYINQTFIWNRSNNTLNYQLQISADNLFNNYFYNQSTLTDTSRYITGLDTNTLYYWRVKRFDTSGISNYSNTWTFRTVINDSLKANLISPVNNSINNYINLNFVWNKRNNTLNYQLQISANNLFSSYFYNQSTLTDTSRFVTGLDTNTLYYWRIIRLDTSGISYYSNTWTFRTLSEYLLNIKIAVLSQGKYIGNINLLRQKDSVNVYLRSTSAPYMIMDSSKNAIDTTKLSNVFSFRNIKPGVYYICVKNKQCVETWSKVGGEYLDYTNEVNSYDFTSAISQAFGNNQILVGNKHCFFSGDINQDKSITLSDLQLIYNGAIDFNYGYFVLTDITGDNSVDLNDATLCYNNFTKSIITIQP